MIQSLIHIRLHSPTWLGAIKIALSAVCCFALGWGLYDALRGFPFKRGVKPTAPYSVQVIEGIVFVLFVGWVVWSVVVKGE